MSKQPNKKGTTMAEKQEMSVREKKELTAKEEKTVPGRYFIPYADIYETDDALMVVMEVPGVVEVAVVAARHPMLDEVPVAFVIAAGDRPELADEVLAACSRRLSDFKVPREVRLVDEMPRSTLNKIAKAELRRQLADEQQSS